MDVYLSSECIFDPEAYPTAPHDDDVPKIDEVCLQLTSISCLTRYNPPNF